MKDFLGNEINLGDTVVVAVSYNSSVKLQKCQVIGFTPTYVKISEGSDSKKDPLKLIVVK